MATKSVYHLDLDDAMIEGARVALLPGDPGRVMDIAATAPIERAREIACKREYRTALGYISGAPVLITSTGIGGPSASIAIDELAQLGVRTFLRVGTTGAIQPSIQVGDVVVTTGSVRLDGASTHYAPIEFPAVAHHEVVAAILRAANELSVPARPGITCSCDTFYPGQERYDSFTGYVPRRFRGITEEWEKLHVLNYEMESATVLTLTSAMGLRGGCVAGVVVNRHRSEAITQADLDLGEQNAVRVAALAATYLI